MCDHADDAVSSLVVSRRALYLDATDPTPIQLKDFPAEPSIPSETTITNDVMLGALRCCCISLQYGIKPADGLIQAMRKMDATNSRTLVLDEFVPGPDVLSSLATPIVLNKRVAVVHFKSFAPFCVCRIAHFLLKKSQTITTLIFEGYRSMVPAQLRMEKVRMGDGGYPVSLVFVRCPIPEPTFKTLLDELSQFRGDFQRLSFNSIPLSAQNCKILFKTLKHGDCFKTLEIVEFDAMELQGVPRDQIQKGITGLIKHCRFLNTISLSHWSRPLNIPLTVFLNANYLTEIVLAGQDMSQLFGEIQLPDCVHLLDFSKCRFTFASILSLFTCLSKMRNQLTLILSDLKMEAAHWRSIFDAFPSMPQLQTLWQLDWSGNPILEDSIPWFGRYFFEKNPMRFLAIDRIFKPMSLKSLELLLWRVPRDKLWGLSLGGDAECNFAGNFRQLMQVLERLEGLHMLHLNGQRMTDGDAKELLRFVQSSICEVSCDGSDLSGEWNFYDFYEQLTKLENVVAVGRPNSDITRLFGRRLNDVVMRERYRSVKWLIRHKYKATPVGIRSFFITKARPEFNQFDTTKFYAVGITYPKCFLDINDTDPYGLNPDVKLMEKSERKISLRMYDLRSPPGQPVRYPATLAQLHRWVLPIAPRYIRYSAADGTRVPYEPEDYVTSTGLSTSGTGHDVDMYVERHEDLPFEVPTDSQGYQVPDLGEFMVPPGMPAYVPPPPDDSLPVFAPPPDDNFFVPPPEPEMPFFIPPPKREVPAFVPPPELLPETGFCVPRLEPEVPIFVSPPPVSTGAVGQTTSMGVEEKLSVDTTMICGK